MKVTKYEPPFVVYNDVTGEKRAFNDPATALEIMVELGHGCSVLDSNGSTLNIRILESLVKDYDAGKLVRHKNKYAVEIYTDGACSGNPGPGGYAGIIIMGKYRKTVSGYSLATTNNKMELKAVIESLKRLDAPCDVTVYTDSQYLCTCRQHKNSWFWREDRPNRDLWFELLVAELSGKHNVQFVKVKGHAGETYNEECDKIAKAETKKACHELLKQGGLIDE